MSKLVIDQGNSQCKAALWLGEGEGDDDWVDIEIDGAMDVAQASAIFEKYSVDGAIYCSTAARDEDLESYLATHNVLIFDHTTPIPIVSDYKSASTLGLDRLAAAVGAVSLSPDRALMVIDMGSAITIDFVSSDGHFLGGNISAGLSMRLNALHNFTGRLPRADIGQVADLKYGEDTNSALVQGAVQGICNEIDGYIDQNRDKTVIFTGGDALFFEIRIKNPIFVDCRLTLRGLLSILMYNA